jgi:hypothetical protein
MTSTSHGGGSAEQKGQKELAVAWRQLARGLASAIETLTDPEQADHLLVELTETDAHGATPYAQFAGFRGGAFDDVAMVRAEIAGNYYLVSAFELGAEGCAYLQAAGWRGNLDIDEERNWYVELPLDDADTIAEQVVTVLRDFFGIAHPQMLVFRSWGPAAESHDHAAMLGLMPADAVPADAPQPGPGADLVFPQTQDELRRMARGILGDRFGEIGTDEDGDLLLWHMGQQVCVYVTPEQPDLVISARVARNVHARRAAAVELSILNRDHLWTKWALRDRDVWQTSALHAHPLVPSQLVEGVELFLAAMSATRDDLALRTGAQVA